MNSCLHPVELRDPGGAGLGLWHFCSSTTSDGHVPIGYCSPIVPCPDCSQHPDGPHLIPPAAKGACKRCSGRRVVGIVNACPGHPSPEEAIEHYRQWLLDHAAYVFETAMDFEIGE